MSVTPDLQMKTVISREDLRFVNIAEHVTLVDHSHQRTLYIVPAKQTNHYL